ncbi:hypothetical protein JCM10212_001748 [Sporobolomyces blumeae]
MADDRFTYVNSSLDALDPHLGLVLGDPDHDDLAWDFPLDHIAVPDHLIPPYQDEDDETLLPSQTHPSYPYGNPYRHNSLSLISSTSSSSSSSSQHPHPRDPHARPLAPTTASARALFRSNLAATSTHAASLRTSLPALELPALYALTSFGDPAERAWPEPALRSLLGPLTKHEHDEDERDFHENVLMGHGDAGMPAGQNAADEGAGAAGIDDDDEEDDDQDANGDEDVVDELGDGPTRGDLTRERGT